MEAREQVVDIRETWQNDPREAFRKTATVSFFVLPYILLFGIFLFYPLLKGFYMSLFNWDPLYPSASKLIWFENYKEIFSDPNFWNAFGNTIYFVILTVPTMVAGSIGLALGVNQEIKGRPVLRTIFFSPYILTISVVALGWQQLLAPEYGPIAYYLKFFMANPPGWLNSYLWAMPALAVTTLWWTVGFNFVIFLAARQNVPEQLYEAARLDGAGKWRAFRDITLPQMKDSLLFVIIVQFIGSFQVFGQPYIMTQGGPGKSTVTLIMYLYRKGFVAHDFGYAAAVGYILFAVLAVVSIVNYYFIGRQES